MPNTLTIAFRGLFVFHKLSVMRQPDTFEVGLLSEPSEHVPRIMTMRGSVLESTTLLASLIPGPRDRQAHWQLVVDNAATSGVRTRPSAAGDVINRISSPPSGDDFRWILNLENNEFPYGKLVNPVFSPLRVVVRIPSGELYTKLQSRFLLRKRNQDTAVPFGPIAGVIGCDIQLNGNGATLLDANTGQTIFRFDYDPNVIYEFSNSPADTNTGAHDHFIHYYSLFRTQPSDKFQFIDPGPTILGPNPALCGSIYLGQTTDSLTTGVTLASDSPQQSSAPGAAKKSKKSGAGKKHGHH